MNRSGRARALANLARQCLGAGGNNAARNDRVEGRGCAPFLSVLAIFAASLADGSQAPQGTQFESTVARIVVDAIVTDSEGEFVDDLVAEDFVILEDGSEQRVLSAQVVDLGAGPMARFVTGDGADFDGGDSPARRPDAVLPRRAVGELGAIVFLIDAPSLGVRRRGRFAEAWSAILADTDSSSVPRAAYIVDGNGSIKEVAPLSSDVARLRSAAELVDRQARVRQSLKQFLVRIAGLDAMRQEQLRLIRSHEERNWSISSITALTRLCESFLGRSGRTAVVWVSSGGLPRPRQLLVDSVYDFDAVAPDARIAPLQDRLHRIANSANVSIYSVDPGTVADRDPGFADVQRTSPIFGGERLGDGMLSEIRLLGSLAEPLRDASEATGGKSFVQWGDLALALQELESDASRYYLLTYAAPRPTSDGRYHEIEVSVRRSGMRVRARRGYTDYPADERRHRRLTAALSMPGLASGLRLTGGAFRSWSSAGEANVLVMLQPESQPDIATQLTQPGSLESDTLEVAVVLQNDDGDSVDQVRQPLTLPASDASLISAKPAYTQSWRLEPGDYTIRAAISDRALDRIGATLLTVTIPSPEDNDWLVSDPLIVVAADESSRPEPVVGGRYPAGATTAVHIQVANGEEPVAEGSVAIATQQPEPEEGVTAGDEAQAISVLPRTQFRPAGGTHHATIPLPGLPPGSYVLHLRLTDAPLQRQAEFHVPLRIVEPADGRIAGQ